MFYTLSKLTSDAQRFELVHRQSRGTLYTEVSVVAGHLLIGQTLRYGVPLPGPLHGRDLPLDQIVAVHLDLGFSGAADLVVVVDQGKGRRAFHLIDSSGVDGPLYTLRDHLERLRPGLDRSATPRGTVLWECGVRSPGLAALLTIVFCVAGLFLPMLALRLFLEESLAVVAGLPVGMMLFLGILLFRLRAALPR